MRNLELLLERILSVPVQLLCKKVSGLIKEISLLKIIVAETFLNTLESITPITFKKVEHSVGKHLEPLHLGWWYFNDIQSNYR